MARGNKKCTCCSARYSYCPDCSRSDKLAPSWMATFCSETCKDLWSALTKFGMGYLTKPEAQAIISNLELKPIDTYAECVKRDYAKVMAEEKKQKKSYKKIEPIVEIEPIIEQPEVDEPVAIEPESHEVVAETIENE